MVETGDVLRPRRAALLNQPLRDGLSNIMVGRDSVASLENLVKQWRANGGDALRWELEQALQERN